MAQACRDSVIMNKYMIDDIDRSCTQYGQVEMIVDTKIYESAKEMKCEALPTSRTASARLKGDRPCCIKGGAVAAS
jgi:hypothetical protein